MPIESHPPHKYDPKDGKDAFEILEKFKEFLGKILIVKLDGDTDKKDGFMIALATITRKNPGKVTLRYYREKNRMLVFETAQSARDFFSDNASNVMEFLDGTYFTNDTDNLEII